MHETGPDANVLTQLHTIRRFGGKNLVREWSGRVCGKGRTLRPCWTTEGWGKHLRRLGAGPIV